MVIIERDLTLLEYINCRYHISQISSGKSVNLDANGDVTISTGFLRATEVEASNGIMANATTVSANYTVPTNYNALSAGPISVDSGITVTVNSGSVWTIV